MIWKLVSARDLLPHGFSYQWKPALIGLHAISDTLIALAYFLIPVALIHFVRKRRDIPFGWMFICFGIFIAACGATHVMEVWTLWVPANWLSGGVKVITAIASVPTAAFLIRLMPKVLSLPSPDDLRAANEELNRQAAALKKTEERFRQMADNIQEIFWILLPQTKEVSYVSPAFEQICERSLDSLYANPTSYRELLHPEDRPRVLAELEKLGSTDRLDEEFRIVCPSGTVKWIRGIGFTAKDSAGKVTTLVGTCQEITARKEMEIALRESEDRYRDLVEHSTDLICTHTLDGRLLSVNELPVKLLGYSREELLNKPMRDFLLPEARAQFDQSLLDIQRDGFVKGSMVVLTKTGERRVWEYHNTLRTDGVTTPVVRGIAHDVTEQRRAEKALRLSEEKFSKAFHASPIEIMITTLEEGRFLDANESFERNNGFTREEVIGHTSIELGMWVNPEERAEVVEQIKKQGRVHDREIRLRSKLGTPRIKRYSAEQIKIRGKQCLLAVCEDITLRKQIGEALRLSEEKFSKAFRNSPSIISISTLQEGAFLEVNESFEKITGYGRNELLGRTALDIGLWIDPSDRGSLISEIEKQGYARGKEFRFRAKSGQVAVILVSVELIELSGVKCLLAVGQDITDRKRAEEALRKAEEQLRAILINSPNLIFLKDVEGRYLLINKEYRKTFHFTRDQIYGKTDIEVFPPDQAAVFRGSDLQVLQTRAPMEFEEVAVHDDGPHTSIVQKFPLFDEGGEIYAICGFVTDITERKRAEERLREYEKAVEGLEEMIVVIDRQYRYQLANRAFLNYRGLEKGQLLGRLVSEVLGEEVFHWVLKEKLDECFQGKAVKFELNYNYPNLGERDLFLSYFPIEGPSGVDRAACVLQDITERKRAEQELQRLSGRLLQSQDEERRRIARDLHDSTGQDLVALATMLSQLRASVPSREQKSRKILSECKALADRCIREVRTLSYVLHPPVLDDAGLVDAIRDYVKGFTKRSGIQVELELPSLLGRMTRDVELALFRIVQESLTNIHRHSESHQARIRIDRDSNLTLEISDLGQDPPPGAPEVPRHPPVAVGVGIHSMQERVKLIGGRLKVDITSHGTTVRVTMPLGV